MRLVTAASCSSDAICPKTKYVTASKAASPNVSDTQIPIPSLADRARPVSAGAPVVDVHFFGAMPVFVLGEQTMLFAGDSDRRVAVHAGAILASASDGTRIVSGGDDGTLVETTGDGERRVLA